MNRHCALPVSMIALSVGLGLGLVASAVVGAPNDPPAAAPQENFFSSLKQAFSQDFDHDVVRGHFDVGTAPDAHRYYCLVDPKTGKMPPNGVAGDPAVRKDGMTGIKASAVSLYSCASAEEQGVLVGTGYVVNLSSAAAKPAAPPPASPPAPQATASLRGVAPDKIDVAGVRLGMSVDDVRAVLRAKALRDYYESDSALVEPDSAGGRGAPVSGGRFVNLLAAWTPTSPAGTPGDGGGEFYQIMFTPVPGRERAMAIVHSAAYPPAQEVRELVFEKALIKKYGGFAGPSELPLSPTWRAQANGDVQPGDACNRRAVIGGLSDLPANDSPRMEAATSNLALATTVDELRFQVEHCGVAIVTEDHESSNRGAPVEERLVSRFTVTAYSPAMGLEAAAAAGRLIKAAGSHVAGPAEQSAPAL